MRRSTGSKNNKLVFFLSLFERIYAFPLAVSVIFLIELGGFQRPTPVSVGLGTLVCISLLYEVFSFLRQALGLNLIRRLQFVLILTLSLEVFFEAADPERTLFPLMYLLMPVLFAYAGVWESCLVLIIVSAIEFTRPPQILGGDIIRTSLLLLFTLGLGYLFRFREQRLAQKRDAHSASDIEGFEVSDKGFFSSSFLDTAHEEIEWAKRFRRDIRKAMEALRDILSPHSIVLYMATKDGFLEIEEVVSESDLYIDRGQKIRPRTGYIGWVAKTKTSLLIEDVKNRKENLIYYKGEVPVKSFLAVPLITEIGDTESRVYNFSFSKELFGILCLDSLCEDAFGNREKQILSIVVEQIIEIFKRYKLLVKVQLEAREFSWLYEFTKKLSYTLELNDITECIVSSICKVVNADLVALLLLDKERNVSVLSRVGRERRKEVEGKGVPITNTLTGWVIEYGRYLYCENLSEREKHKSVFGRKLDFALGIGYIKPILIYPLLVPKTDGTGNEPSTLGCIVIGRKEGKSFTEREKNLVEIMVREASISLSNSIMYQRTKELAITDGLTNLYNHRHFQERLSDSLAWADRFYGRVSLILTDVDSFKALNDTYGHQVGDSVLRTLARIFKNSVRRIDVVARYGGDEFAIILVNTDQRGAKVAVDKLRDLVEKTHFGVEGRELFVTVSLGVATYPDDASTRELLIERADQALYHAKRIGRNKGLHYEDIIKKEARG